MYATKILTFVCGPYSFAYLVVFILAIFLFRKKTSRNSNMFALTSVRTFILQKKLGRPIGPLEKELILTDEKRRGSKLIVLLRLSSKVRFVWFLKWPEKP